MFVGIPQRKWPHGSPICRDGIIPFSAWSHKKSVRVQTRFIWLKIGCSDRLFWIQKWAFWFYKSRKFLHQLNKYQLVKQPCTMMTTVIKMKILQMSLLPSIVHYQKSSSEIIPLFLNIIHNFILLLQIQERRILCVKDVGRVLDTSGLSFITSELIHENVHTIVTSAYELSRTTRISDVTFLYTQVSY